MKRSLVLVTALGASLLGAGYVVGQSQNQNKAAMPSISVPAGNATAAAPARNKLIKVATINGAQANRDFQSNVQLVQTQRLQAIELQNKIKDEKDAKKKAELQTQLDQQMAKLAENNNQMVKTYGFSLMRDYVMEIEVSNIYLVATEEEAAKFEAETKRLEAEQKAKKK